MTKRELYIEKIKPFFYLQILRENKFKKYMIKYILTKKKLLTCLYSTYKQVKSFLKILYIYIKQNECALLSIFLTL